MPKFKLNHTASRHVLATLDVDLCLFLRLHHCNDTCNQTRDSFVQ